MSSTGVPGSRARARGSSLIEALMCVAIMGIVTSGMYAFFLATNQTYGDQAVVSRTLWTANDAMRLITQDLRQAGASSALVPSCALLLPPFVTASNLLGGSLTIRIVLDDPVRRTEVSGDQPKAGNTGLSGSPFSVLSTSGYGVGDVAFLTDGAQCTRFSVTGLTGGLQHDTARDANTTASGTAYTYLATNSLVYRQGIERRITYAIDNSDPRTPWLTRDTGAGPRRVVPDVESIAISYLMADGSRIPDAVTGLPDVSSIDTAAEAINVRSVGISVVARADTRSRAGQIPFRTQTLTAIAKLRNLGL